MSVRNVGVPVTVTVAFSNVRSLRTSCTAFDPSAKVSSGALPTSTAASTACRASGMNAWSGLRIDEGTVGWSNQLLVCVDREAVVAEEEELHPVGIVHASASPAAPSRSDVTTASCWRSCGGRGIGFAGDGAGDDLAGDTLGDEVLRPLQQRHRRHDRLDRVALQHLGFDFAELGRRWPA